MSVSSSGNVQKIVTILRDRYGEINWWPWDRDKVMIGAILTWQSPRENVTRASAELRSLKTHAHIVEQGKRVLHKNEV